MFNRGPFFNMGDRPFQRPFRAIHGVWLRCRVVYHSSWWPSILLDIKQVEGLTDHNLLLCLSGKHRLEPPFYSHVDVTL